MDEQTIQNRRWSILGVLVLCLLVVILDNTILNVALKTIQGDLNASQSDMQWAVDSYALVFAGLLITWGVLGDRLGRKKVLMVGLVIFGAMSALCSFSASSGELIAFRALMGIGAAAVQPQTLSIIQNVFEPRERPKAIGIWAGASGMAIALGPITGGVLLKYFWWGSIFLVNVPIVIVAVIAIFFLVPDSKDPHPGRLDPFGVLLSIVALGVLVYGVIEGGNTDDWLRWNTLGAIVLGVVLLALFVWTQARSSHPTIDVSLFKNRHFSAGAGAIAAAFFALQGATFYLAYYLQAVRGYSPLLAGTALIAVAAAVMIAAPSSAKLSGRFGPRVVTGVGMTLFGVALAGYGLVTQTAPIWSVLILLALTGAGLGLTMSPATNAIMSAVPREKAGAGSAVNNTVRQVAGALGVAILGSILVIFYRGHLGADAPQTLATKLDQPTSVVSKLPASQRVGSLVQSDSGQSIENSLQFAGDAGAHLRARGAAAAGTVSAAEQRRAQQRAETSIGGFVGDVKSSFMSAMNITSLFGAAAALIGAATAFGFLPGRREFAEMGGGPAAPPAPGASAPQQSEDGVAATPKHLDAQAEPVAGGTHSYTAVLTSTANTTTYPTGTSNAVSVTVAKATTSSTFAMPAAITYGTPLSATQLAATSATPGTFAYTPPAGTVLSAGTQGLSATLTPTDSTGLRRGRPQTTTIVVNKAALTATAANATRMYGAANPTHDRDADRCRKQRPHHRDLHLNRHHHRAGWLDRADHADACRSFEPSRQLQRQPGFRYAHDRPGQHHRDPHRSGDDTPPAQPPR